MIKNAIFIYRSNIHTLLLGTFVPLIAVPYLHEAQTVVTTYQITIFWY